MVWLSLQTFFGCSVKNIQYLHCLFC